MSASAALPHQVASCCTTTLVQWIGKHSQVSSRRPLA